MKLSEMLNKIKVISKELLGKTKAEIKKELHVPEKKDGSALGFQKGAIVIKSKKNSVLIKCWNDGKELWVKRGSHAHNTGLCSRCILEGSAERA